MKLCHFNCSARAVRARLNKHVDDLSAQKSGSRIGMVCKYIIHRFLATFAMMPVLERYHADIQHVHVHFIILGQHENENINKYCILYRKRRLHLFMQMGPLCFVALPIHPEVKRNGSLKTSKNLKPNLHNTPLKNISQLG